MGKHLSTVCLLLFFSFMHLQLVAQTGTITISSAATSGTYTNSGGIITSTSASVNLNISVVTSALASGNLEIRAGDDIIVDASISVVLSAERTLTFKTGRDIKVNQSRAISATGDKLNLVFWSDSDNSGTGAIFLDASSTYTNAVSISTNGGHLWMGGGNTSTTWNGLTVGTGYANGGTTFTVASIYTHYNGITLIASQINTSGGHIQFKGQSTTASVPASQYSGGIWVGNESGSAGAINSNGGNIDMQLLARSGGGAGFKWGFFSFGYYPISSGAGNITISGDASLSTATGFGDGIYSNSAFSTTTGNISLTGIRSGSVSSSAGVNLAGSNTISTSGNISLLTDRLSIAGTVRIGSSGSLNIFPLSVGVSMGIAGGVGSVALPTSYFTTNFNDGFNQISLGTITTGGITLGGNLILRDKLNITSGTGFSLGAGSYTIQLGNNDLFINATITNAGATRYFNTNGTGKIISTIANGASFTFPVGATAYNPVTITNNSGSSDEFSVKVRNEVLSNGVSGSSVPGALVLRTWDIDKQNPNGGTGVNFVFNWNSGETTSPLAAAALFHHGSVWEKLSPANTSSTSTSLTYTGYTGSFSPFAVIDGANTLPVELVEFKASCKNSHVLLEWATANEENNSHFIVERLLNGQSWESVGEVKGNGNSQQLQRYSFTDVSIILGAKYRLRQVDKNGKESISTVVSASCGSTTAIKIRLYPNPVHSTLYIDGIIRNANYKLWNQNGQLVRTGALTNHSNRIDVSNLPAGIYKISLSDSNRNLTEKIVIQR